MGVPKLPVETCPNDMIECYSHTGRTVTGAGTNTYSSSAFAHKIERTSNRLGAKRQALAR